MFWNEDSLQFLPASYCPITFTATVQPSDATNIKTLHLGRNITWISFNGAIPFQNQISLTTLTIGSSVSTIGGGMFSGCNALTKIESRNTTPPVLAGGNGSSRCFDDVIKSSCNVYVPSNALTSYRNAFEWKDFSRISAL